MCARELRQSRYRQHGVSMVELLVGLVVAALVALTAFSSSVLFGAAQRQAVSASSTTASLVTTLASIKAEIGSAALGFAIDGINTCAKLNLARAGAIVSDGAEFLPVAVSRSATSPFDTLTISHATDSKAAAPVRLAANVGSAAASVPLRSWLPVQQGQQVLLAPAAPGEPCTVREVDSTSNAVPGGAPYTVRFAPVPTPGFAGPTEYSTESSMSVLGQLEQRILSVDPSGRLQLTSQQLGGTVTLVEDVVAWRIQYGVNDGGTGNISWVDPTGEWSTLDAAHAGRVRALRLGIVARSPQREKGCAATLTLPVLFGEAIDVAASDPQWQCHRYRRAETVVPLRNLVWGGA
jgi:type IV pilus assembly protein PilW